MTPLDYYNEQCQKGVILQDPEQLIALKSLQRAYDELVLSHQKKTGFFSFLHQTHSIKGVYLWGGVGVGKTFMLDYFFHCLPFKQKKRMHFHQFMQRIHHDLTLHQGESDPLQVIAEILSREAKVICFDEFFVSDITDAMLLGRLLKALFAKGVCFVATSNIAPDELYQYGLQRLQFLPAIDLLKRNTEVVNIKSTIDYRLRHLKTAGIVYSPMGQAAFDNMQKTFAILTRDQPFSVLPITINDRSISIKKQAGDIVWFDFKEICHVPRSQNDYLAIAKQYKTVFISDIPVILPHEKDIICLFVCLVDVLYDARVKLVISAAEPVADIYSRGFMILEYTRTHSRLLEMQSQNYFIGEDN